MFDKLRANTPVQYVLGLLAGVIFGFLLQKGGVTRYEVIINQLLLTDFTVVKVMLTAMVTGMIGIYFLQGRGLVELHPKSGSLGTTIPGPLIFGIGFGTLGYCPGTAVGAVGHGALDALIGGIGGMMLGVALYAAAYPRLKATILDKGSFGDLTLPQWLKVSPWTVGVPLALVIVAGMYFLERAGL